MLGIFISSQIILDGWRIETVALVSCVSVFYHLRWQRLIITSTSMDINQSWWLQQSEISKIYSVFLGNHSRIKLLIWPSPTSRWFCSPVDNHSFIFLFQSWLYHSTVEGIAISQGVRQFSRWEVLLCEEAISTICCKLQLQRRRGIFLVMFSFSDVVGIIWSFFLS